MKKTIKAASPAKTAVKQNSVDKPLPGGAKRSRDTSLPIIGMGGAAGSLKGLEQFFLHMPADAGMAFVIVMHPDPHQRVSAAGLIQKFTAMPVVQAEDDMLVKRDHVYVIPPNKDMGIHNQKLLLFSQTKSRGHQMPVDYFLRTLAEDQRNNAVAIILSGAGTDGETGVRMIKEKLGMAMVQAPESADHDGMPKAVLSTGLIDYVLMPQEMPAHLVRYFGRRVLTDDTSDQAISESKNSNAIQKILMLLRSHTGHDFSLYKKNTVTRRIDRRIAYNQLPGYLHYITYLRENPQELDMLFNELLIGVTKFFRYPQAFELLKEHLYKLIRKKREDEPLRIWIPGCSTGEEAYSIAIVVMEYFQSLNKKKLPQTQIFATALDPAAIEHARRGVYYNNIVSDVSDARLERFFVKKGDSFSVKKELREMVVFAQHNLVKDAPFTRLDLLCCRNVMIYLTAELQKKILPIFHYSLNPNGILLLGPAETTSTCAGLFNIIDSKWKLFGRQPRSAAAGKTVYFPFNISARKFAGLYDLAPVGYFILDKTGTISDANGAALEMLDIDKQEVIYGLFQNYIDQESLEIFHDFIGKMHDTNKKSSCLVRMLPQRNKAFYAQLEGKGIRNAITGDIQLYIAMIDITERKEAERKLQDANERLKMALEASATSTLEIDLKKQRIILGEHSYNLLGLNQGEFDGQYETFFKIVHPHDKQAVKQAVIDAIKNKKDLDVEYRVVAGQGTRYISIRGQVIDSGADMMRFVGIITDITGKKQLERDAASLKLNHQNNIITAGLLAQEKERKRISESLHDSVSQLLYGIKLHLHEFSRADTANGDLTGINSLIDQAINETRNIAFQLAPSILHDFGLIESVKEMAKRLSSPTYTIRVKADGQPLRLEPHVEISAFRIIQELINNSIKHGGASEAVITINILKGQVTISVKDNGAGFDAKDTGYLLRGTGLLSIKNRVSLLNGLLDIKSVKGKGTTANVILKSD